MALSAPSAAFGGERTTRIVRARSVRSKSRRFWGGVAEISGTGPGRQRTCRRSECFLGRRGTGPAGCWNNSKLPGGVRRAANAAAPRLQRPGCVPAACTLRCAGAADLALSRARMHAGTSGNAQRGTLHMSLLLFAGRLPEGAVACPSALGLSTRRAAVRCGRSVSGVVPRPGRFPRAGHPSVSHAVPLRASFLLVCLFQYLPLCQQAAGHARAAGWAAAAQPGWSLPACGRVHAG